MSPTAARGSKKRRSAGILLYKRTQDGQRVLLVHPGGPFWARKDSWSLPKGEYSADEEALTVARREFREELGREPTGDFQPLGEIKQAGGKTVTAWAVEGDFDPATLKSNTFGLEWPPKSGRRRSFPEVDRAEWFSPDEAKKKIHTGQRDLIDRLVSFLS
jgi:predicted NUDIX family NTP pyrophosphohydrolase